MAEVPNRAGPTLITTTSTTIYTAGAASTWAILRSILMTNVTAFPVTVTVGIGTTNTDAASKRIVDTMTILADETVPISVFVPLAGSATTPDLVYAFTSVANAMTITLGLVTGP